MFFICVQTGTKHGLLNIAGELCAAHKTRYTSRAAATAAAAEKKDGGDAERPAAPVCAAGEGAGVLVSLPVAAAAGDPEGAGDDGDCPENGAPASGAGTETT